ncbi:hypothetical protein V6N13_034004 [Hibiscus sabdariffa]|uniref:Uncharacterized protein n=1 Tax=Hibiscus sabdariffa TaxID=183260 RepID=A0ABR2F8U0_9ROSI
MKLPLMVSSESVTPSSRARDQPWLYGFLPCHFPHEVRAPHCQARKALPALQVSSTSEQATTKISQLAASSKTFG